MIPYKFPNGRIMARDSKGRFRNFTLKDFGIEANTDYMVCGKCGYGEKERWIPIVKTGICPKCGNQENHKEKVIPLSKKAEELVEQIDKLETKIGKTFIDPIMWNEYGGDLKRLRYQLEDEVKFCAEKSFE